jgi:hypothetical protein
VRGLLQKLRHYLTAGVAVGAAPPVVAHILGGGMGEDDVVESVGVCDLSSTDGPAAIDVDGYVMGEFVARAVKVEVAEEAGTDVHDWMAESGWAETEGSSAAAAHAAHAAATQPRAPIMEATAGSMPRACADEVGQTPFWLACASGWLERARVLLAAAGPRAASLAAQPDADGITPLCAAAGLGRLEVARWLVAGEETSGRLVPGRQPGIDGFGPLHAAAMGGHRELVALLAAGPAGRTELAGRAAGGWGPLHAASYGGRLQVVQYLAEVCGASPGEPDAEGRTPADVAAAAGHGWGSLQPWVSPQLSATIGHGCVARAVQVAPGVITKEAVRSTGTVRWHATCGRS